MGGRTAVHAADDPAVRGVVALAPWFPAGERVDGLVGRSLRAAHGRRDRITSYRATAAYVERAGAAGVDATLQDMGRAGHYLLSRVGALERVRDPGVAPAGHWSRPPDGNSFVAGMAGRRTCVRDETKPFRFIQVNTVRPPGDHA